MRRNVSLVRWRSIVFTAFVCCAAAGCGSSDDGNGAGNSNGNGSSGGSGGDNGAAGSCPQTGPESHIRVHIVNSENVANIRVVVSTPHGNCAIDPLPTATDAGLELGQALYPLVPGDIIGLQAQSPSGGATGQCRVTEQAVTEDAIFIDLFITTAGFICSSGVEPVNVPAD